DEGVEEAFVLQIADFLLQADMVKFAKFSPPPEMVDEAMPVVENILGVLIQPKVGKEAPVTGSVPS
ncbi:MAG: hypothetical protein HOH77_10745, partial [Candidatus Latescibacteria bacterium]|nr:hypothetical protein [Candidatus Latescibacterota bacterium]